LWVDESRVSPDPTDLVTIDLAEGGVRDFSVGRVWDNDTQDTIYLRWFINYDENSSVRGQSRVDPSGTRERSPWTWTLNICGQLRDLARETEREHLLEVVLSDREFLTGPAEVLLNRTLPADARIRTVFWRLKVQGVCLAAEN